MSFEAIQKAIYAQIDIEYEAVQFVQTTWMRKVAEREMSRHGDVNRRDEKTNYEFRLEFNGASFTCRWIRVQFVKRGTKTIRVTKSIAIPRDCKYKRSQFKYADEWELSMIEQIEDVVSKNRISVKHLMKSHFALLNAAKYSGNKIKSVDIKQRVIPTTQSIKGFKQKLV